MLEFIFERRKVAFSYILFAIFTRIYSIVFSFSYI